jgi:hypothetical protein
MDSSDVMPVGFDLVCTPVGQGQMSLGCHGVSLSDPADADVAQQLIVVDVTLGSGPSIVPNTGGAMRTNT